VETQALSERLPRLTGLVMFEAAARSLSFTTAAAELGVSQAAVSQQVRALERQLGVDLFVRLHRGLKLTDPGQKLFRAAVMGFGHIAEAADVVRRADAQPVIAIGATYSVATFWLVSRLAAFRALHPSIETQLIASDRGFEAVADRVDVGISYGIAAWPGFNGTLLTRGDVFPVCSRSYLRGRQALTSVEQLPGETLLSLESGKSGMLDWSEWLAHFGVRGWADLPGHRRPRFNSHSLLMQAACEGQGIALGWSLLAGDLLRSGRLVRPLDAVVVSPKGFYLLVSDRRSTAEIAAFCGWLTGQFREDQGSAPAPP
jgi:LysR family transcriptional regulator, glycine cleavage system transcriptional activator